MSNQSFTNRVNYLGIQSITSTKSISQMRSTTRYTGRSYVSTHGFKRGFIHVPRVPTYISFKRFFPQSFGLPAELPAISRAKSVVLMQTPTLEKMVGDQLSQKPTQSFDTHQQVPLYSDYLSHAHSPVHSTVNSDSLVGISLGIGAYCLSHFKRLIDYKR
jgi:hypothetical protein